MSRADESAGSTLRHVRGAAVEDRGASASDGFSDVTDRMGWQGASSRADSGFVRHFPTFCTLWDAVVSASKWLWARHRPIADAMVVAELVIVGLYACWEAVTGPQREAVAAIRRGGGSVSYDWEQTKSTPGKPGAEPPWPRWLVKALGQDRFGHVVAVHLPGRRADNALMAHIGRLTRLEELTLLEFQGSEDDLANLAGLIRLKVLMIFGGGVTNKGLLHLSELRQMESLWLPGSQITTLEPIRGMTQLKVLFLRGNSIDDEGLKPLEGFSNLEWLSLDDSRVTDAGMAVVSILPNLKILDLRGTRVGNAGVRLLAGSPRINHLNLFQTQVTDAGLAALAEQLNGSPLGMLLVSGPGVTSAGVVALRKKVPRVQIVGPDRIVPPRSRGAGEFAGRRCARGVAEVINHTGESAGSGQRHLPDAPGDDRATLTSDGSSDATGALNWQGPSTPVDSGFARHFPTFCVLRDAVVAVWKWLWLRHRAIANAMLVAALVIIVLYGCWEAAIGPQRDAVAAIMRARGSVSYDWEWSNDRPKMSAAEPAWPTWLVKSLGQDCFGHVVAVHLPNRTIDNTLMAQVGRLARLEHLNLFGASVPREGLVHLEKLTSLETLLLPEFQDSDDDLAHLAGLVRLKRLVIFGRGVTNKGLAHLSELRQMESLRLLHSKITTLEPIRGMTQLKELNVVDDPIDDEGLKPLEGFTNLERLSIGGSRVSDAGMAAVSKLPNLKMVDLGRTGVGDAVLDFWSACRGSFTSTCS